MEIILKYFPELNPEQINLFEKLYPLYQDWNSKINVVSRKDFEELYERHVLHSLAIAKFIKFVPGTKILDVGTGGGFPGIPLAIYFPKVEFHLVDSIGKKIKVVNEVAASLNLKNVKAEQIRAEQIKTTCDFVVSRAVTQLPEFVSWIKKNVAKQQKNAIPNGILYLKGGNLNAEIKPFKKSVYIQNLDEFFEEEFFETKKLVHLPL
jgi:16S rRNA (guanine527-N7)-methyltransferase